MCVCVCSYVEPDAVYAKLGVYLNFRFVCKLYICVKVEEKESMYVNGAQKHSEKK